MFKPMQIAREIVLRKVAKGRVHYGIVVECVRISDVHRLVSGYDAFHILIKEGVLNIDSKGFLSLA